MSLTLINLAGFSAGVAADEQGINIEEFKTTVEPEFRNVVPKKNGTARGIVVAPMKKNVTLSGEVNDDDGVMAASATAAFAPANSSAYFGAPATSLLLLKGEVTENRDQGALKKMSAEFEALAGVGGGGGGSALTYLGNCEWEPSSEPEPSTPMKGLPSIREPWIGRSDKTAQFLEAKEVGSQYLGGYIQDNTPRENSPFFGVATVELLIATPPDFQAFEISNTLRQATATKSATVNNSQIIDGASEVAATREVAFDSPGTRYTYFTSGKPNGPRFTQAATSQMPRMRRSTIRASANNEERTFTGLSAPGALVSALTMPVVDVLSDHQAEEIVGTPWFRCTDVISREFLGD